MGDAADKTVKFTDEEEAAVDAAVGETVGGEEFLLEDLLSDFRQDTLRMEGGEVEYEDLELECDMEDEDAWCNDPEILGLYMEYLDLLETIEHQNMIIDEMKCAITKACAKPCKNICDMRGIQSLRCCLKIECQKLNCLMQRAIELQNCIPRNNYAPITIATTLEEDNQAFFGGCYPKQLPVNNETNTFSPCHPFQEQPQRPDPGEAINRLCDLLKGNAKCASFDDLQRDVSQALYALCRYK